MAYFQAKIGWTRRRKRENKNSLSVPFLPDGKYKIPKKEKKNKKLPLWLHFMPKQVGKGREKEKIKFGFRSSLTRNRKFQKRMARKLKNFKKNHYGFISSQNRLEKAEKERK